MRFAVLAVLLSATSLLRAQIDNGNLTGRVTDPAGAAIVGAQVTVTQTEMNFETVTTTNEEGLYRALNLRPGPYRVTVVAQGFKRLIRDSIDLRVGQTLAIDASLVIGAVGETVEVSAKAALLDTETSSSGTTLAGDYLYNLPNYQRHAVAVLLFTPGVTVLNRPICLHRSSERKRSKIKQIGRFQSVYLVQSVHALLTPRFQTS